MAKLSLPMGRINCPYCGINLNDLKIEDRNYHKQLCHDHWIKERNKELLII